MQNHWIVWGSSPGFGPTARLLNRAGTYQSACYNGNANHTHNWFLHEYRVLSLQLSEGDLNALPNGIDFSVTLSPARRRRQEDTPDSSVSPSTSINIPASIISSVLESRNDVGVIFTYYSIPSLFPLVSNESEIATPVTAARFSDQSAEANISDNVSVNFQLLEPVSRLFIYIYIHDKAIICLSLIRLQLKSCVWHGTLTMEVCRSWLCRSYL